MCNFQLTNYRVLQINVQCSLIALKRSLIILIFKPFESLSIGGVTVDSA